MYSPCMFPITARDTAGSCSSSSNCNKDILSYSQKLTNNVFRTIKPIGIAKDGRVIYGPYTKDGKLWQPCDVDVCNGRFFGENYAYVATMFFPYVIGCWGPGNGAGGLSPSCTNKPRLCKAGYQTIQTPTFAISLALMVIIFSLFE